MVLARPGLYFASNLNTVKLKPNYNTSVLFSKISWFVLVLSSKKSHFNIKNKVKSKKQN